MAKKLRVQPGDHAGAPHAAPIMDRSFFNRDPRDVAPELLGKLIVRRLRTSWLSGRIVEAEVYLGSDDGAAHVAAGLTARNSVLFGPPGHAYVYFIYGMHYCLNISCMPEGQAGSILLRALEPVEGIEIMAKARKLTHFNLTSARDLRQLTSGPGKLCQALGITRQRDNGKDLLAIDTDLQIRDDTHAVDNVAITPRIGITKSTTLPLRYVIAGNHFVSYRREL